jgi:hypothetical protein
MTVLNYPSNFEKSFIDWHVDDEFGQIAKNYILHGFPPGSFFEALFANDFLSMSVRSHPANTWAALMKLGKWILNVAPPECYGNYAKVKAWIKLSQDERIVICERCRLVPTAWELLQKTN